MKPRLWFALVLGLGGLVRADVIQEIALWNGSSPEPIVRPDPPERTEKGTDGLTRRWYVSRPRLLLHRPPAGVVATGASVIVVPGGGFGRLADEHEGADACRWLAEHGAVAFQLLYRTPTTNHLAPNLGPVQDCQRAVALVRQRAAEWAVDPAKIGVLGFSAGGQVALVAATNPRRYGLSAGDGEDAGLRHQPDFLLVVYPYQIFDSASRGLRSEIHVETGLPPTFIAQMGDDPASVPQGSVALYLELLRRQVPAELHLYERGGHGFGLRSKKDVPGPGDWSKRAVDWLHLHGWAHAP